MISESPVSGCTPMNWRSTVEIEAWRPLPGFVETRQVFVGEKS